MRSTGTMRTRARIEMEVRLDSLDFSREMFYFSTRLFYANILLQVKAHDN